MAAGFLAGARALLFKQAPPDNTSLKQQGNALLAEGRLAEAMACYEQAASLGPQDAAAHVNWGYTLVESASWSEAERVLRAALGLDASIADAWFLLGQALAGQSQASKAEEAFRQALALQPDFPFAARALAVVLAGQGRPADALEVLATADLAYAGDPSFWHLRGNLQFACRLYENAAESYGRAIELHPDFVEALSNRAVCCKRLGRREEAHELFARALALRPMYPSAIYNLGVLLLDEARCEEVLAISEEALRVHPQDADIHVNRADALLLTGRLGEGWLEYEWRWKARGLGVDLELPQLRSPRWTGQQPIEGKTLLVLHEQGLGDSIQFMRFVPLLLQRAARVLVQLPPPLVPLFAPRPGMSMVHEGQPLPPIDFHVMLPSLPMAFATEVATIPASVPYVVTDPVRRGRWEKELGPRTGPRVGLVWAGNPAHANDANRSMALATLLTDAPPGVQWVSLQKDVRPQDLVTLEANHIFHAGKRLADFADTAALADAMDLVISVDTSVAHLVGALGKPLWVLLPFRPDWRWMLGRSDSPWYPSARLFRQDARRDWASVVDEVMQALREGFGLPALS